MRTPHGGILLVLAVRLVAILALATALYWVFS